MNKFGRILWLSLGIALGVAMYGEVTMLGVADAATLDLGSGANRIGRNSTRGSAAINSSIGSCDAIIVSGVADAAIEIPTGVSSVTFWACDTVDGTYRAIYDHEGNAATITTTADRWYSFPPACFPHSYIKIVSAGANGTAKIVAKT